MSWDRASPSERSFFERTQLLSDASVKGFVSQTDVAVAVAVLIDRAAETKIIASKVLHMLLIGHVGDKIACFKVKSRLAKIQKGLAKYSGQMQSRFSPQSVQ